MKLNRRERSSGKLLCTRTILPVLEFAVVVRDCATLRGADPRQREDHYQLEDLGTERRGWFLPNEPVAVFIGVDADDIL